MSMDGPTPSRPAGVRRMTELSREESMRLLGSVTLGQAVFTWRALPAPRPVSHLLDGDEILVRTHADAALAVQADRAGAGGIVVAFEAEPIDPHTHLGWSVIVTRYARLARKRSSTWCTSATRSVVAHWSCCRRGPWARADRGCSQRRAPSWPGPWPGTTWRRRFGRRPRLPRSTMLLAPRSEPPPVGEMREPARMAVGRRPSGPGRMSIHRATPNRSSARWPSTPSRSGRWAEPYAYVCEIRRTDSSHAPCMRPSSDAHFRRGALCCDPPTAELDRAARPAPRPRATAACDRI